MVVDEFLSRIAMEPALEVVYRDPTFCIIRCVEGRCERMIRLGFWAVRRVHWEQIVDAFHLPVQSGLSLTT